MTTAGWALLVALVGSGAAAAPSSAGSVGAVPAADTLGPVMHGRVAAPGVGRDGALPGALIQAVQGERVRRGIADAEGRYRIRGLAPGRAVVTVSHVAAHPFRVEVRLPATGELPLDLELERRVLALAPIVIRPAPAALDSVAATAGAFSVGDRRRAALALRTLDASPGMVETGLARGLARDPPEGEPSDPGRTLLMRGSTVDARTVLLDGAPILTPFHLAGLVPSLDPRVLGDARIFLGGAPARYEGGLSHVLDVETRAARRDRIRGDAAVDGLAVRGGLEAPLPLEGGLLVAGRHLHGRGDAPGAPGVLPYGYSDLLLRADARPVPGHELRVTAFGNRESVRLDLGEEGGFPVEDEARWGNRAVSAGWWGRAGETAFEALVAGTRYRAALPVFWTDPLVAHTESRRLRASLSAARPRGAGLVRWGALYDRQDLEYRLQPVGGPLRSQIQTDRHTLSGERVGAFAEAELPLQEAVVAGAGARVDWFAADGSVRVAPRASLRVALTPDAVLTAAGGLFHQHVPVPGLTGRAVPEGPDEISWNPVLAVASALHLVLGLDQQLSDDLSLGVSGFVKRFEGAGDGPGSRVNASGTDLRVTRAGERTESWVGYALSWFWEPSSAAGSTRFAGRHLVTAGLRARLDAGPELGVSVGYGAGLPLTDVGIPAATVPDAEEGPGASPIFGSKDGIERLATVSTQNPLELAPEEDFLRMDLEASWAVHPTVGGRETELRPYVRVLNALNRRDALFYYFDRFREPELHPLAERPFLPVLGVEWRF